MELLLLLFFICGIIFIRYLIPLLDQLLAWHLTFIEVKKSKLMVKQQKYEKAISDIAITMEQPQTNQIGFIIPPEEEENLEDDEI